jgi:hypothetical protein
VTLRLLAVGLALCGPLLLVSSAWGASVRIALAPMAIHTAEPDSEYVSAGLAEMLSARLERSGAVAVVRLDPKAPPTSLSAARESARAIGADYVVFGSFTQFGSGASLDVRCAPVAGSGDGDEDARHVFIQSGTVGEIIPRLDDLADKVTRYVLRGAPPAPGAANAEPGQSDEVAELRARVEALERALDLGTATAEGVATIEPEDVGAEGEGSPLR